MRVLLCLLSAQHIPNLLSVHHYRPDVLVLLETPGMKKRDAGINFLDALASGGLRFSKDAIVEITKEDSVADVTKHLEVAYERWSPAEWIVNLTGGTKPMSIAAYEFFKHKEAKLVYINNSAPNTFVDLGTDSSETSDYRPTIQEFLEGYGYEYGKKLHKVQQAEERAKRQWKLALKIAENAKPEDLLPQLNRNQQDSLRQGNLSLQPQMYQHFAKELRDLLEQTFTPQERSAGNKYMGNFFTGGWLEVFFWELLNHHADELDLWDVHLGIEPRQKGSNEGTNNDMDVAFMRNHTLSFVECKSGSQDHDKGNDILYKVEAIRRQLGALRVKSFLATTAINILDEHNQLKEAVANRAALYECTIITCDQIRELARDWQNVKVVKKFSNGDY